jgi:RimJ/RimL family protein N-acetyltransferase
VSLAPIGHVVNEWRIGHVGNLARTGDTILPMPPPGPTARLSFREMTPDDLDVMADLLGDPEVMAFYSHPKSRAETLRWIDWNQRLYRERGFGLWLIELRETGGFVGDCGLTPQVVDGKPEIEVGYHVRRPMQGRGLATEAAAASRDYAREVLGLTRLVAIIDPGNVPSQRLAEKIGLALEKETDWAGKRVRIHAGRP